MIQIAYEMTQSSLVLIGEGAIQQDKRRNARKNEFFWRRTNHETIWLAKLSAWGNHHK